MPCFPLPFRRDSAKLCPGVFYLKQIFRLRESLQMSSKDEEKPFLDHLEDLRKVILRMALTLLVVMMLCFGLAPQMMDVLRRPVERVWSQHELDHLPNGVRVEDWERAKALAGAMGGLSPRAQELLRQRENAQVLELHRLVPVLKAAAILPEGERMKFVEQACLENERELALALLGQGAVLQSGSGRAALRMMGSFQPGESFLLSIKMAFFGGCVISFPLLMFFLLQFIVPGLLESERRFLLRALIFGFFLFLSGCFFAYFAVLPRVLAFFYEYSLNLGIENDWRIGYYLSFAVKLIFMFGIAFELPVLIIPLVKLGVLDYELMSRTRVYAIACVLMLALLIAPAPDPGTMLVMAIPMYLLYELCIGYARLDRYRKMKGEKRA